MSNITDALAEVRGRIEAAAQRADRPGSDVTLVAVSKTRTVEETREAIDAGAVDLGENYVQEMVEKWRALGTEPGRELRWHAIGHIQRNKVKYIAPFCHLIHSIDSTRLADEVNKRAGQAERTQPVLIELNIAQEDSKFGATADGARALAEYVAGLPHIELQGLMAMTPYDISADESRAYFAQVRELSETLGANLPRAAMQALSMGMTQDYEVAVEEGATIVRVGTAIFGHRAI